MEQSAPNRLCAVSNVNIRRCLILVTIFYTLILAYYTTKHFMDENQRDLTRRRSPGGGSYTLFLDRINKTSDYNHTLWNGEYTSKTCKERTKIVLLKTHKCASSTISNILIRYAMKRNLVIALPKYDEGHIGWPSSFQPEHIYRYEDLKAGNLSIDVIPHHLVYNRTSLDQIMPRDAVYVSIIREPFAQFTSTMSFFKKAVEQLRMPVYQKDAVKEFLKNPTKYERNVTFTFNDRYAGEKSITRNFMATEFSFPASKDKDEKFILEFLRRREKEFHLVMLYEELFESVVLFRRLLCWDFKDILFTVVNKQSYRVDKVTNSAFYRKHRKWSAVDHALYYHFRKVLQMKKSAHIYRSFVLEASYLRKVAHRLNAFCELGEESFLVFPATVWHTEFRIPRRQCDVLNMYPHRLDRKLKKELDIRLAKIGIAKREENT